MCIKNWDNFWIKIKVVNQIYQLRGQFKFHFTKLWQLIICEVYSRARFDTYRRVTSSNTSHFEAHTGLFRLFMKEIFELVTRIRTRNFKLFIVNTWMKNPEVTNSGMTNTGIKNPGMKNCSGIKYFRDEEIRNEFVLIFSSHFNKILYYC